MFKTQLTSSLNSKILGTRHDLDDLESKLKATTETIKELDVKVFGTGSLKTYVLIRLTEARLTE